MVKIAIVVLAGTESHESLGRVVNALELAKELQENNDEIKIVFDGAGTEWVPELENENHDAHPLYNAVKENIHGACRFCAKAFGVINEINDTEIELLDEYDQHPSLRNFIVEGYQIVTF
ncbi:DsrE family protein [Fodinibius halophilus]|uniref:DsrE family protein n=1 Tax=Fodinibius halophilus TaxID=1736908 RepID=A0A6M1T9I7_9BACT|nr:DsrE family protein [Fodinibius halophilus]NGP90125.1 DsrE family protein [Fodinibius halophilus]